MALLDFGPPPTIRNATYADYLPWLEHRCFDETCAYCLESRQKLQVDHITPVSLDETLSHDPDNLLPACSTCNGPSGKWDYHPLKSPRKKSPNDVHGYLALNPKRDDVATLYALCPDGSLTVKAGPSHLAALWNRDVLFRLNRPKLKAWRKQALDLAEVAEQLVAAADQPEVTAEQIRRRDVIVREVAQRLPFFEILDLPLSGPLLSLAQEARERGRRG
jgi:hypothetical protein